MRGVGGISTLPTSLQKLVRETEYPPERPSLLQTRTTKVAMIVGAVSPTPFALLRRANHFQYRDDDRALQAFSEYEDPVNALTDECRRVLRSISSANQSHVSNSKDSTGLIDTSWSRFEDIGFSAGFNMEDDDDESSFGKKGSQPGLRTKPSSKIAAGGRPTTPSWAEFLSSGFVDETTHGPAPLLLPPDKVLPPIDTRGRSSQSHGPRLEQHDLEPGELASITQFDLDDSFWWVWISSLAGEESDQRKAAFGRCALIETKIKGERWLVVEEIVKGAAPEPAAGAYIAEKKSFWGRSKKGKTLVRRNSLRKPPHMGGSQSTSKTSIGPDQHARIQAAAMHLQQRNNETMQAATRRGRNDPDTYSTKTNSVFTLQPVIVSEASPAMKWAKNYDKDAIREAYLANSNHEPGPGDATSQTIENSDSQSTLHPAHQNQENPLERNLPATPSSGLAPPSQTPPSAPLPPTPGPDPQHEDHLRQSEEAANVLHPTDTGASGRAQSRVDQRTPEPRASEDQVGYSPETKHKRLKKREKDASASGFRKMFGTNKNRNAPPQAHSNGGLQPGKPSRRFASFRKKTAPPPVAATPSLKRQSIDQRMSTDSQQIDAPMASPGPGYDQGHKTSNSLSRVDTNDAHEAREAFSSFDQGPVEETYAPTESVRSSQDIDAAMPPSIAQRRSDDAERSAAADRWARIHKDAAERTAMRPNEEQSRGGHSAKTDGDDGGDTSGEESKLLFPDINRAEN